MTGAPFRLPGLARFQRPVEAEADIVERFLTARAEADFRQLYRRLDPQMQAVARRLLGGQDAAAADVAQEAWLRAMRTLSGFERRSSFRSWLIGFVINVAREAQRAAGRGPVYMAELPDMVDAAAPDPARAMTLDRAVGTLPPRYRAVLMLHDVAGLTHAEIAAALAIDEGTSKSQLSRARQRLRARLDPERTTE